MKIIWIHHRLLESSFSPVNKNWGYQALILPWSSAKSLMWILTFSMTWDVLWKRVATTWDVLAARWRKMAWVICWPGKWGETKKGTPKRGACDEHLKVKSCWAEDILPARWWWKTRNRSLMMFRLSLLGNSSRLCQIGQRLDCPQILDSVAFRCVESLKTIIQTRECLPWCHCRSSNDKCKIACKWQGAQLISNFTL